MRRAAAAVALLCAGCTEDNVGLIAVSLVTAPSSGDLDDVASLRVTLTNPAQVIEAPRTAEGFALALEVEAKGQTGSLVIEGFRSDGALAVSGTTPAFNVSAIDASLVVYMAPPLSIGGAPVSTTPADAVAAPLPYGAILASGAVVQVYNAYDHSNLTGVELGRARTRPALGARADGIVYVFGGLDETGTATGTLQTFDTTVPPRGTQTLIGEFPEFARAGARAVPMGNDSFLVTGDPAVELVASSVVPRADLGSLGPAGASRASTNGYVGVFAGPRGIVRVRSGQADVLDATPRPAAAVVAISATDFAVLDGATREVIRVNGASGELTVAPDRLPRPFATPIATATSAFVVVAGAGEPDPIVCVLDLALAPVAVIAAPGLGAPGILESLPDGQALLGGAQLSLFTPPPPEVVTPAGARTSERRGTASSPPGGAGSARPAASR